MQEKELIRSFGSDAKKIFKIMAIIGLVLALLVFMSQCSSNLEEYNRHKEVYEEHQEEGSCYYYSYGKCYDCEYIEEHSSAGEAFGAAFGCFVAVMALAVVIWILLCSFALVVTDKRVYCKVFWIHQVCIPVDSITAVGRIGFFNVIAIGAPAGRIVLSGILNSKDIYNILNDLLIARQQKPLPASADTAEPV